MNISGRGGHREGSGRPSSWHNRETVAIRIPKCLVDDLLDYARQLDKATLGNVQNHSPRNLDNVQIQKALEALSQGLHLKANSGGAIKVKIREAIDLLENVQYQVRDEE